MNKNILTAAIGAAMIVGPLAAQADLKISGRIAGEFTSVDGTLGFADWGNSRFQVDAKDDSGWFARTSINIAAGGVFGSREQQIGIKMDAGTLMFGRMAGAVKNIEKDPFIATFLELRRGAVKGGSLGSSGFRNNLVSFSNKMITAQYDVTTGGGEYNLAVKAKLAGAKVFAGFTNDGNSGNTFYKLGASMGFGDIKGKFYYESDGSQAPGDETTWVLGAEMGMGDGAIIDVSYSDKGFVRSAATYRIAYMKKVSKKVRYWAGYSQNGSDGNFTGVTTDVATYGGGVRVDF